MQLLMHENPSQKSYLRFGFGFDVCRGILFSPVSLLIVFRVLRQTVDAAWTRLFTALWGFSGKTHK